MNQFALSNGAFLALIAIVLLALAERAINHWMTVQVRRNLSAADQGQPSPYSMRDWRRIWAGRRAARVAAAGVGIGLAAVLILSAIVAQANSGQRTWAEAQATAARWNFGTRNKFLARAEKMARLGHKGLMYANIAQAKRFGPVDVLMVARVESYLAR